MNNTMTLKEIANIGKSALILAVGLCENYKREMYVEEIDFASCSDSCPFKNLEGDKKYEYCKNNCTIAPKKKPEVVYVNEKNKYKIKFVDVLEQKRLSKLQLQQFLLYHFLNVDSNGVIKYASIKEIASMLNCTKRSVRENNEVLKELGLIVYSSLSRDVFSIAILGYKKYRDTRANYGTGYIPMPKEFFKALLNFKNVNTMRLAIRLLVRFDDMSSKKEDEPCMYSYNDLKHFMPKNISYKNIIDKTLEGLETLFDIEKRASVVVFKLKNEFNGKVQKVEKKKEYTSTITNTLTENNIYYKEKDISDLVDLSIEYGLDTVINAISIYISKYKEEIDENIYNFGGFIRQLIKKSIFERLVA